MTKNSEKILYFKDELNDELSGDNITPRKIDGSYKYYSTSLWKKFTHFFWYRMVAFPIFYVYMKIAFGMKIENRKVLKPYRKTPYFLFANHTNPIADAVVPTFANMPKNIYLITNAANVSVPVLGPIVPSLGAIPLPDDREATKNFLDCINYRMNQKQNAIIIYPEAHIWPFYTKIRPFLSTSFRYPIQYKCPVFTMTTTYQKRKILWVELSCPKIVTYIDGPFFPDEGLSSKDQKENLRNKCYNAMCERSKLNTVEMIKYIKIEGDSNIS